VTPQDGAGTGPEGADCAGLRGRPARTRRVAVSLGLDGVTVGEWRRRFVERRIAGLYEEPRFRFTKGRGLQRPCGAFTLIR
jgi:hypothetical protein